VLASHSVCEEVNRMKMRFSEFLECCDVSVRRKALSDELKLVAQTTNLATLLFLIGSATHSQCSETRVCRRSTGTYDKRRRTRIAEIISKSVPRAGIEPARRLRGPGF
jgi:hypothetical protein